MQCKRKPHKNELQTNWLGSHDVYTNSFEVYRKLQPAQYLLTANRSFAQMHKEFIEFFHFNRKLLPFALCAHAFTDNSWIITNWPSHYVAVTTLSAETQWILVNWISFTAFSRLGGMRERYGKHKHLSSQCCVCVILCSITITHTHFWEIDPQLCFAVVGAPWQTEGVFNGGIQRKICITFNTWMEIHLREWQNV